MRGYGLQVHPKGQGRTVSYAKSLHAGSSDAEAAELYAAFADCDGQALWLPVHRKLTQLNVAHHLFARSDTHWHLVLWFSSPLQNPHAGDRVQTAAWKSTFFRPFYGALLGFFSELLGLDCKLATPEGDPSVSLLGFDAKTDRLLNLQYAPCRRSEDDDPPSVVFHQGLALNPRLLLEKLELLPDEQAPVSAPRRKRSKPHREPVERRAAAPRPPPEAPANDEADHELIDALGQLSSEGWRKGGMDRCARALGGALGASGFEAERAATIVACAAWRAGCGAHVESMKKKARKAAQRALDDLPVPQLGRLRSWFPDLHRALLPHLPLLRSFLQKEQEAFGRLLPPDEASSKLRKVLYGVSGGAHLFVVTPGTGKSHQLVDWLVDAQRPTLLFAPTHALSEQLQAYLHRRGLAASAPKGVTHLRVVQPDGSSEHLCQHLDLAERLAPLGPVRQLLCPACPERSHHPLTEGTCPAYALEPLPSASVQIHMHVRLADVLAAATRKLLEHPDDPSLHRLAVIDEGSTLVDHVPALAHDEQPFAALLERFASWLTPDAYEALAPLAHAALQALPLAKGELSLHQLLSLSAPGPDVDALLLSARAVDPSSLLLSAALQRAARLGLDEGSREPTQAGLSDLRALVLWLEALLEGAHDPKRPFLGFDTFAGSSPQPFFSHRARWCREAAAFLDAGGSLVLLDATGHAQATAAALDRPFSTTVLDVRDAPGVLRFHISWSSGARRYLVDHDRNVKPKELRGVLRDFARLLEQHQQRGLPAQRIGILTHQPVALALQAAIEQLREQLARSVDAAASLELPRLLPAEFAKLVARGVQLDIGYFGAQRGLNRWAECDALLTLGNPWPNVGAMYRAARVLGLDPESFLHHQLHAELVQAWGRGRAVHRTSPLLVAHYGIEPDLDLAPQWAGGAGSTLTPGRPTRRPAGVDPSTWPAARQEANCGKRAHARASGIAWGTYGRWEGGPPPPLHRWPETPHSMFLGSLSSNPPPGYVGEEGGEKEVFSDPTPPLSSSQEEFRARGAEGGVAPQEGAPPHAAPEARKEGEKTALRVVFRGRPSPERQGGGSRGRKPSWKEEEAAELGEAEEGAVWRA